MRRRAFLSLSGLALGCEMAATKRQELPFGLPPWHMWGSSVRLQATVDSQTVLGNASGQLLRVNYKRPETWSFWVGAQIVQASSESTGCTITILYDLIAGVGRSVFRTEQNQTTFDAVEPGRSFVRFTWNVPANPGTNLLNLPKKWTTVGRTPALNDVDPDDVGERVEWFPAQDIQSYARMQFTTVDQALTVVVEVTAFVAPRAHMRPDWFGEEGPAQQFLGGERGGT